MPDTITVTVYLDDISEIWAVDDIEMPDAPVVLLTPRGTHASLWATRATLAPILFPDGA